MTRESKVALGALSVMAVAIAIVVSFGQPVERTFDSRVWMRERERNPRLNQCPAMMEDLLANHLKMGMTLEAVTNMLGWPETRTGAKKVTWVRGEFSEQVVYVYHPGMHNGWMVEGTNSLTLYFGDREDLKTWLPPYPLVRPVKASVSEASQDALTSGRLHVGNLRFADTRSHFDHLLGVPDETRTEWHLVYNLGKARRFAWDDVMLELHFNENKELVEAQCLEY